MNGVKKARINCCHRCRYRVQKHASQAGPHGFSIFCTACERGLQEIHDGFVDGPAENCPMGFWKDLDPEGPVDPEEWRKWHEEQECKKRRDQQRQTVKPLVSKALEGQDQETVDRKLERLVAEHDLEPEVAAEIGDILDPQVDSEGQEL